MPMMNPISSTSYVNEHTNRWLPDYLYYRNNENKYESEILLENSTNILGLVTMVSFYIICSAYIGPALMRNRKPFDCFHAMRLYNLINFLINTYLVGAVWRNSNHGWNFITCDANRVITPEFPIIGYCFYVSRVFDWFDTLFFVLRKKESQITRLHLIHHAYVPIALYLNTIVSPSSFVGFFFLLNGPIHMIMYLYYFLATFPSLSKHLWWKRYLTGLQVSQFIIATAYFMIGFILLTKYCSTPSWTSFTINAIGCLLFLYMFIGFYKENYLKKTKNKQDQIHQNEEYHKKAI